MNRYSQKLNESGPAQSPTGTKSALSRASLCIFGVLICAVHGGCVDSPKSPKKVAVDEVRLDVKIPRLVDVVASDWPQLFGPQRRCFSNETGVATQWGKAGPLEAWRVDIGTGYSSPVVAGNQAILMHRQSDQEVIESFDCRSGASQWRFAYHTDYQCKYEYSSGPYSTPLIWDDCIFVVGAQAQLRCLGLADGTEIWHRDLSREFGLDEQLFGFGASPWIENDKLILNVGAYARGAGIVAFDCRTGRTVWTATDHRASYATPIATTLFGERYLFVFTYDGLVALDPLDGGVRWIEPFKSKSIDTVNATSPAVWQNHVIVMHGPGAGAKCFKVNANGSHELVWQDRRVLDSQFNSLLSHDGFLYGFTAKREGGSAFRCIDFVSGKLQWSVSSEIQRGSCVAVDSRIILWGEEGHLAAIDLDPSAPVNWRITDVSLLEKPCYAAPALASKRLFLRNERHLIALDLSSRE